MTKSQERLLNLLCDNAATLGKNWLEKNRKKYEDDLYKAFRYLQDKYFKRHDVEVPELFRNLTVRKLHEIPDVHQEAVDMMSPEDKKLYEKWYVSMGESGRIANRGMCEDEFIGDEIMDAI